VRVEHTWNGSTWVVSQTVRYLYDGMRVIQERDGNNVPTVSYTRGNDLSGSLEGAGGIGGLLARSHGYSGGSWANHNCYHADGGGNITYLMTSAQGLAARYRYDPYGRLLSSSGPLAGVNLYRFASKEVNPNYPDGGGYYYFGYRFYDPNLQRWLNRDPLGEAGGINLYAYVRNRPTDAVDPLGESDQNRPPIIVIGRPGGPITPIYGPPRPEPGIYPGSGSPREALELAGFLDPLGAISLVEAAADAWDGDWGNAGFSLCTAIPGAGKLLKANKFGRTVMHHSIPRAAQKQMNPDVANNPLVRGKKGNPNLRPVDEAAHKQAHSSPPGNYYPGGDYNRRFDQLVGDYDKLTPERAREIGDQCMQEFFK
jgi:RHS repeat-associated protein